MGGSQFRQNSIWRRWDYKGDRRGLRIFFFLTKLVCFVSTGFDSEAKIEMLISTIKTSTFIFIPLLVAMSNSHYPDAYYYDIGLCHPENLQVGKGCSLRFCSSQTDIPLKSLGWTSSSLPAWTVPRTYTSYLLVSTSCNRLYLARVTGWLHTTRRRIFVGEDRQHHAVRWGLQQKAPSYEFLRKYLYIVRYIPWISSSNLHISHQALLWKSQLVHLLY